MIGSYEVVVVIIVALLLFGPDRLPELARSLGKAAGEFKKAQMEVQRGVREIDIQKERNEKIKKVASDMGIDVENKDVDELLKEMREKNNLRLSHDCKEGQIEKLS